MAGASVFERIGIEPDLSRPGLFLMRNGRFVEGLSGSDGTYLGLRMQEAGASRLQIVIAGLRVILQGFIQAYGARSFEHAHDRKHMHGRCEGYRATQRARVLKALALNIRVVFWSPDGWVEVRSAQELDEAVSRGAELYDDREDDECRPSDNGNPKRTSWSEK